MTTAPHVLLVDDDRQFSGLTQEYLEMRGLRVTLRHSGDEGLATFRDGDFDLCILDVKMPMKDGFTLATEIRQYNDRMPLIFLTGQTDKENRIKGFTLGADDYVTKPFSMEELFLRIQAILKRAAGTKTGLSASSSEVRIGRYHFYPDTRELSFDNGKLHKLTAIEAKLLRFFLESENGTIERETALKRIWSDEDMLRAKSLNVYVSKLRNYLQDDPSIEILNVHGIGYQMIVRTKR